MAGEDLCYDIGRGKFEEVVWGHILKKHEFWEPHESKTKQNKIKMELGELRMREMGEAVKILEVKIKENINYKRERSRVNTVQKRFMSYF